jgi:hypothetical protein
MRPGARTPLPGGSLRFARLVCAQFPDARAHRERRSWSREPAPGPWPEKAACATPQPVLSARLASPSAGPATPILSGAHRGLIHANGRKSRRGRAFVGTSRGVGKFLSSAQAHRDTSGCRHCRAPPRAAVLCPSISADLKGHLRDSSPVADGLTMRKDAGGQRSGAGWTPKFTRHRYFGATCRGRISRCSELELCPGQPALAYRHHAPSLEASNGRRGEWRRRA